MSRGLFLAAAGDHCTPLRQTFSRWARVCCEFHATHASYVCCAGMRWCTALGCSSLLDGSQHVNDGRSVNDGTTVAYSRKPTCALGDFALHPSTPLEWKCTHLVCTKQSRDAASIASAKGKFARFALVHSRVNKFCAAI